MTAGSMSYTLRIKLPKSDKEIRVTCLCATGAGRRGRQVASAARFLRQKA